MVPVVVAPVSIRKITAQIKTSPSVTSVVKSTTLKTVRLFSVLTVKTRDTTTLFTCGHPLSAKTKAL